MLSSLQSSFLPDPQFQLRFSYSAYLEVGWMLLSVNVSTFTLRLWLDSGQPVEPGADVL